MKTLDELIEDMLLTSEVNSDYRAEHADEIHYLKLCQSYEQELEDIQQILEDAVRQRDNHIKALAEMKKIIRCKDCKHFSCTTIGMPYACWRGGSTIWGETGEHQGHHCCIRVDSPEHFCSYAERREE